MNSELLNKKINLQHKLDIINDNIYLKAEIACKISIIKKDIKTMFEELEDLTDQLLSGYNLYDKKSELESELSIVQKEIDDDSLSIDKTCQNCKEKFIFDNNRRNYFIHNGWALKYYCKACDELMYKTYGFNRNDWPIGQMKN